jgi:hypothetical protein
MAKRRKPLSLNEPLRHLAHKRPVTRRDFLAQGFLSGAGMVIGGSLLGLLGPRSARALSTDLEALKDPCDIAATNSEKIPFICFDLAGGANIAGSNVLVGGSGGQMDLLSTAGYSKLGLPGDMLPGGVETNPVLVNGVQFGNGDWTDTSLGLAFHSDSQLLRGILEKAGTRTANVNGAIIPARSDNDTGNNPHNPMYGIARYALAESPSKSYGSVTTLIGSRNSESGGNSMAPAMMIDPQIRPTKVDRPSDVTGLVDTGDLTAVLSQADAVKVMEAVYRISDAKLGNVSTRLAAARDDQIKDLLRCGYVKAADLTERFGDPASLDPMQDQNIVGDGGTLTPIFSAQEFNDGEFRKTASVMKMVVDGFAGAGTITMGGFDYHTGERGTGEQRDLRAGRCMGACIEYAARVGVPLMIYVFSDGSLASNGRIDDSQAGRGKGEWTGDNSSTAASFFLVFDPNARPGVILQQVGHMRSDASVETSATPAANQVNLLVETVILNYMALHGEQGLFSTYFPNNGLGSQIDSLIAFDQVVNGVV